MMARSTLEDAGPEHDELMDEYHEQEHHSSGSALSDKPSPYTAAHSKPPVDSSTTNATNRRPLKREVRVLGIDDAPFDKYKSRLVLTVGAVFRGGEWLDGILSTKVRRDGDDSTMKLARMITSSRHHLQLQAIMIDGIALAGFNVIDINKLAEMTKLPVVTLIREMPDMARIDKALENVPDAEKKRELMRKAGPIERLEFKQGVCFGQMAGISKQRVIELLDVTCTRSLVPEPLRVAHIIASGIVLGESKGRA